MTEWNASGYARVAELQEVMAGEVLALLTLNGNEQVLDLGCGNGKVTAEIAARVPEGSVVGVDASDKMIAFAEQNYGDRPNLRFQTCDIRRLPFHDEFDLIVSFNALHWIPDQENALRALRSAIKPGARAQLRLVPDGERKSLESVLEETRESPRWARFFESFHDPYLHLTPVQYAALAERSGFRLLDIRTQDKAWDFETRAAFEAFGAVTFVEWSKRLPEQEKRAFVQDVLDRYALLVNAEHSFRFYQMDVVLLREE
jgi:trans-aconitate 2-methyltransferase